MNDDVFARPLPYKEQLLNVVNPLINPIEVAITINQIIDDDVNADQARQEIRRLTSAVEGTEVDDLLTSLREEGFSGEKESKSSLDDCRLDSALELKTANPITLAMVILGVANYLEVDCYGIKFPQHFMANVEGNIVDPYHMDVVSEDDLTAWAKKNRLYSDQLFDRASNEDIAIRMLNNVSSAIEASSDPVRALQIIDYKEVLLDNTVELLIERAGVWAELGEYSMAKDVLEQALHVPCPEQLKKQLKKRIRQLGQEDTTVN